MRTSDGRDKSNIEPMTAGIEFISRLQPVDFTWSPRKLEGTPQTELDKRGEKDNGFVAQHLIRALDDAGVDVPGLINKSNPDRIEVNYEKLIPVMVNALIEANRKIESLTARVNSFLG